MSTKEKTFGNTLAIFTAAFLALIKITTAYFTHSAVIFALALDSVGDVISALINRFFLMEAEKPADADHHFGHGKIENFAALLQSGFLILLSIGIVYKAAHNILTETIVTKEEIGIFVLIFVMVVGWFVAKKIEALAQKADSPILQTDALHLKADVYTHFATIVVLLIIKWLPLNHISIIDPIASIILASYIAYSAGPIFKASYDTLVDKALSEQQNETIKNLIFVHYPRIVEFKNLRTRKLGSDKNISFDLIVCRKITLQEAHDITDTVEKDIEIKIPRSQVFIHTEPCDKRHCATLSDCIYDKTAHKS